MLLLTPVVGLIIGGLAFAYTEGTGKGPPMCCSRGNRSWDR